MAHWVSVFTADGRSVLLNLDVIARIDVQKQPIPGVNLTTASGHQMSLEINPDQITRLINPDIAGAGGGGSAGSAG
ncbi:MAG TPA: hypothetical protein PKY87_16225 [Terricaulis sp.]|nr:hypothetical protein [Terricaulis sp.]